jgi:hypothetical protein
VFRSKEQLEARRRAWAVEFDIESGLWHVLTSGADAHPQSAFERAAAGNKKQTEQEQEVRIGVRRVC